MTTRMTMKMETARNEQLVEGRVMGSERRGTIR
jgi:hypothetical protein